MATIIGTEQDDTLAMLAPRDTLLGRAGNDVLLATFDLGLLDGGTGDDRLVAEGTDGHRMQGGIGNDAFEFSGASASRAHGGEGDDAFILAAGSNGNVLTGAAGDDFFSLALSGGNVVSGGLGADAFQVEASDDVRIDAGADADSFLFLDANANVTLRAGAGNDMISAVRETSSMENSALGGGPGDDSIFLLGVVNSTVTGDAGNDDIAFTGGELSTANGGTGDDELSVSLFAEACTLVGGTGNDILSAANSSNCVLDGGLGDDVITAGAPPSAGAHRMYGGAGDDEILVSGGSGYQAFAGSGNDRISLINTFSNTADGGAGDDTFEINVNLSGNLLTGGEGRDFFAFGPETLDNIITDFDRLGAVQDLLDFSRLPGFAGRPLDALVAEGFLNVDASASVTGGAALDTVIRVDLDGAAGGEAQPATLLTLQDVVLGTTGADADNWFELPGSDEDALASSAAQATPLQAGSALATIAGTEGDDELAMAGPGDTLLGRGGNDVLRATFASGTLLGGTGEDSLLAEGTGGHRLDGGEGDDLLELRQSSSNEARGAGGDDDFLVLGGAANRFYGDDGHDAFSLVQARDASLSGGAGNDRFELDQCEEIRINGGADDDSFLFSRENEGIVVRAEAGNDSFSTLSGDAPAALYSCLLSAGAGGDRISLDGAFDSILNGDAGNDFIGLYGGTGSTVNGGAGSDMIDVVQPVEFCRLNGGAGQDFISLYSASNIVVDAGAGNDSVYADALSGDEGYHTIDGGAGFDDIFLSGLTGCVVNGDAGGDLISLGSVTGTRVNGGDGDDVLEAFTNGSDNVLSGGGGGDQFRFNASSRGNVIIDFDRLGFVQDRLDLRIAFGNLGLAGATLDELVQAGYLIADGSANVTGGGALDTVVRIDPDGGTGSASAQAIVTLQDVVLGTTGADADNWLPGSGGVDSAPASLPGPARSGSAVQANPLQAVAAMAIIAGTEGDDALAMLAPGDTLMGRGGNDELLAAFASGRLLGGPGADRFVAQGTDDHRMQGGEGNDAFELTGSSGNDVRAGAGDDVFAVVGGSDNRLQGDAGADAFSLTQTRDSVVSVGPGPSAVVLDQSENIRIEGGALLDAIDFHFDNANITVNAGAGNDIFGYTSDEFAGVTSSALLNAGAGEDLMSFAVLVDSILNGDAGDDFIVFIGGSRNTVNGGAGNDQFATTQGVQDCTLNGGAGHDSLSLFSSSRMAVNGGAGNDFVYAESFPTGNFGFHVIHGDAGADALWLEGAAGNEVFGDAGNDRITLNSADGSTVDGGGGGDLVETFFNPTGISISGGGGGDMFRFNFLSRDNVVQDFARTGVAQDQLLFDIAFDNLGRPDDTLDDLVQEGFLIADGSANVMGGRAADTVVRIDPDGGAGAQSAQTIVTLKDVVLGTTGSDADNWLV